MENVHTKASHTTSAAIKTHIDVDQKSKNNAYVTIMVVGTHTRMLEAHVWKVAQGHMANTANF
jgi:hypothetical protein